MVSPASWKKDGNCRRCNKIKSNSCKLICLQLIMDNSLGTNLRFQLFCTQWYMQIQLHRLNFAPHPTYKKCWILNTCNFTWLGNSRKYPYPTTDDFHVSPPPLPSEIPECATPRYAQHFIIVNPPLSLGISAFFGSTFSTWQCLYEQTNMNLCLLKAVI